LLLRYNTPARRRQRWTHSVNQTGITVKKRWTRATNVDKSRLW